MTTLPDIPRLYTALAEVLAVLLYAHRLLPRMNQRVIWGVEAGWAVLLGAFLQATGKVPLAWWIPCMAMAILSMLLFLWVTRSITLLEAGYVCARAFILAELAASGAQIAHISPAHHYPTGIVMPIRRRNALLAWAAEAPERYIIEDDYDSELRHTGLPVPPLFSLDGQGRVLYLSTFSQTIAPSLRIAYLCLPPRLMERLRTQLGFYACAVPSFEQFTLARFIASGDYERHLNRLRKRFREKRAAILAAIAASSLAQRCEIIEENAGTHFLLRLATSRSDAELKRSAAERGLSLRFLSDYRSDGKNSGCAIVNYVCMPTERLPAALKTLAELL